MYDLSESSVSSLSSSSSSVSSSAIIIEDETTSEKVLDVEETFAPRPHLIYLVVKLIFAIWLMATMIISILEYAPYYGFWFAYLSSWGLVFTVMYQLCSFMCAALLAYNNKRRHLEGMNQIGQMKGCIGILLKITWSLFAVAFPAGLVIAVLFWVLVFKGRLAYTTFMLHGVAWIVMGVDGIIINRIPMRMKQFILYELFAIFYLIWSVLHSALNVGNPWNDDEEDDGTIYKVMDWKNNLGFTLGLALGLLLIGNPIAFLLCRAISRSLPLRCCNDDARQAFNDEESLEVPARARAS